jgi:outer membrane protein, heavy metal efflux system
MVLCLRVVSGFLLFINIVVCAQDTVKLNLHQADSLFQLRSLYLLAAELNVDAQKAQIIQARLYPNPVFVADLNVYDPENNKVFHVGPSGQKVFALEQLIILGGKRKSEIEMARTNAAIAELEFQSLARQLKFRLHTLLYEIGQQQHLLNRYTTQLALLDSIVSSYAEQVSRGNIPLKDLVRIKGVYLNLNNDRAGLLKEYLESQASVQMLLQTSSLVQFEFSDLDFDSYIRRLDVEEMINDALINKPELAIIRQNKALAGQYFQYQKRLAVPDINLFASYDQRGGAFVNQVNTGVGIPLPLWNRNQGNIKSAQYQMAIADYQLQAMEQELTSGIRNNYLLYLQTTVEYRKALQLYNEDFEITVAGMSENFRKRNVSLIEFVDFFEAYNEVLAELVRIKVQLVESAEQINVLTGKDYF